MGMTTEQLVELAYIEAFPGQSQNEKGTYRFELEAMVKKAMVMLAKIVAKSPDYQVLQRTVTLPILASHEIEYSYFGLAGDKPAIDNGVVFGNLNTFAVASRSPLVLSGSPLNVRSQYLEWQILTVANNVCIGILPLYLADANITDITQWLQAVRIGNSLFSGDVFAAGVHYAGVFGPVTPGDYFRFQWAANGDLFITQFDANRTVVALDYPVVGGNVAAVGVPGVLFAGDGGQVTVGRMGVGTSTSLTPEMSDGLYRLDLQTSYQFLTSYLADTGTIRFAGTDTDLSFVSSLLSKNVAGRCDTWYWTLEGEQIVFWPGATGTTLPANSLQITGSIIPIPTDLPADFEDMAISLVVESARARSGLQKKR